MNIRHCPFQTDSLESYIQKKSGLCEKIILSEEKCKAAAKKLGLKIAKNGYGWLTDGGMAYGCTYAEMVNFGEIEVFLTLNSPGKGASPSCDSKAFGDTYHCICLS